MTTARTNQNVYVEKAVRIGLVIEASTQLSFISHAGGELPLGTLQELVEAMMDEDALEDAIKALSLNGVIEDALMEYSAMVEERQLQIELQADKPEYKAPTAPIEPEIVEVPDVFETALVDKSATDKEPIIDAFPVASTTIVSVPAYPKSWNNALVLAASCPAVRNTVRTMILKKEAPQALIKSFVAAMEKLQYQYAIDRDFTTAFISKLGRNTQVELAAFVDEPNVSVYLAAQLVSLKHEYQSRVANELPKFAKHIIKTLRKGRFVNIVEARVGENFRTGKRGPVRLVQNGVYWKLIHNNLVFIDKNGYEVQRLRFIPLPDNKWLIEQVPVRLHNEAQGIRTRYGGKVNTLRYKTAKIVWENASHAPVRRRKPPTAMATAMKNAQTQ